MSFLTDSKIRVRRRFWGVIPEVSFFIILFDQQVLALQRTHLPTSSSIFVRTVTGFENQDFIKN